MKFASFGAAAAALCCVLTSGSAVSQDPLVPEEFEDIPKELHFCAKEANVLFLLDLSSSLGSGTKDIVNQQSYVRTFMDAVNATKGKKNVKFAISAYSRVTADVRSLNNPRSEDVEFMKRTMLKLNNLKHSKWDDPQENGFHYLTKPGHGYTHIDDALRERVFRPLDSGDHVYCNTTVILFTDGKPENYEFRNRQGGKQVYTNFEEFSFSLQAAKAQRTKLFNQFGRDYIRVHCVQLRPTSKVFRLNVCDTYEDLFAPRTKLSKVLDISSCKGANLR